MMQDQHQEYKINNSIFLVEIDKIKPNPLQPRAEFDEHKLKELSESIRQYGILQPLVVIRQEREVPSGTVVEYELVAGERRLRASKLAGLTQVPVIIRREPSERVKLELALLENVQREDLNPIERATAFKQLTENFGLKQREIGEKMGKSREFVANSLRLLALPQEMQKAVAEGAINEGHTRPLLMLSDRPEAQQILFKDIIYKKLSVRDAEQISRRIAHDRARKHDDLPDAATRQWEENLARTLGTRVTIERKGMGGTISIAFFSDEELRELLDKVAHKNAARNERAAADREAQEHFETNASPVADDQSASQRATGENQSVVGNQQPPLVASNFADVAGRAINPPFDEQPTIDRQQPTTGDEQSEVSIMPESAAPAFIPEELKTPEIAPASEKEMLSPADIHEREVASQVSPAIPPEFGGDEPPATAHVVSVATLDDILRGMDGGAEKGGDDSVIVKEAVEKFVI